MWRLRRIGSALLAALILVSWQAATGSGPSAGSQTAGTVLPNNFFEITLASGLVQPTAMSWAPDGRLFVAEKAGRVLVVQDGVTQVVYDLSPHVNNFSDQGLLGLTVDTNFAGNGFLYLLYTYDANPSQPTSVKTSRLTRVTVNPNNTLANPSAPETVILGTHPTQPCPAPSNTVDCIQSGWTGSIGTVRADPDGTLWVGSGDAGLRLAAYNEQSFAGKLIHIDRNGRGLPGHPFCPANTNLTQTCTKLYAKGFRNPFRFTLRPGTGPVVGDVGHDDWEEIDLVRPGKNYGWPCYEGEGHFAGQSGDPACSGTGGEYSKEGTPAASVRPDFQYSHDGGGAAVVAGPVYKGSSNYPTSYVDSLFYADYARSSIRRLQLDAQGQVVGSQDFATGVYPVDLALGPHGNLSYVDIAAGEVREIAYSAGNQPPQAQASAAPTFGPAPLEVVFSDASTDPDGDQLTYSWDFGDGSPLGTTPSPTHDYLSNGTFTAALTISDPAGLSSTETITIYVGGQPPVVTIASPAAGSTFTAGQTVNLSGSASDAQDGTLPAGALQWDVELHHNTHIHYWGSFAGATASFPTTADHDADSFYRITLSATDSSGLTSSRTVDIQPKTVRLTLRSNEPGVQLSYGGYTALSPIVLTSASGYRTTVSAPPQFHGADGRLWVFQSWSDGGAAFHQITVPAVDTTLTANYVNPFGAGPLYRYYRNSDTDHYYQPALKHGLLFYGYEYKGCEAMAYTQQGPGMIRLWQYHNAAEGDHLLHMGGSYGFGAYGYKPVDTVMYAYPTQVSGTVPLLAYSKAGQHLYTTLRNPFLASFGFTQDQTFKAFVPPPPAGYCN